MTEKAVDVAIVGGGLAGGLIALAMHNARPELRIVLIEKGKTLGGNHRWSWFASDLDTAGSALLDQFRLTSWDAGYDVRFSTFGRTLSTGYRSLSSIDFSAGLLRMLPEGTVRLGCAAAALDKNGVTLESRAGAAGERILARTVIDCRPFEPSEHLQGGWQVFLGRRMRLGELHGMTRPTIMDANVDQLAPHGNRGAFRFVYTLPLGADEVFVEDTYYADDPLMDRSALSGRIDAYCRKNGWDGDILDNESGVLPVITGGDFAAYQASVAIPGVAIAGARGGFSHPLTSYTMPIAVNNALMLAGAADYTGEQVAALLHAGAKSHWRKTGFYRMLGKMLFGAAEPHKRDRIFAQFYRRPQALVERFYRTKSTWGDRLSILSGRPPVSIARAIAALRSRGKPLIMEKTE